MIYDLGSSVTLFNLRLIHGGSLVTMASLSHKPDAISKEIHNMHQLIILGGALEGEGQGSLTQQVILMMTDLPLQWSNELLPS